MTELDHRRNLPAPFVVEGEVVSDVVLADHLPAAPGTIVDGEVLAPTPYRSPLDPNPRTGKYPTSLRGGVVSDPDGVAAVAARTAYARLPRRVRRRTPAPAGW